MKWFRRGSIVVMLLVLAVLAGWVAGALRSDRPTGFQAVQAPGAAGATITVGIWYPTDATPWPTTLLGLNLMSVARDAPIAVEGDGMRPANGRGTPTVRPVRPQVVQKRAENHCEIAHSTAWRCRTA